MMHCHVPFQPPPQQTRHLTQSSFNPTSTPPIQPQHCGTLHPRMLPRTCSTTQAQQGIQLSTSRTPALTESDQKNKAVDHTTNLFVNVRNLITSNLVQDSFPAARQPTPMNNQQYKESHIEVGSSGQQPRPGVVQTTESAKQIKPPDLSYLMGMQCDDEVRARVLSTRQSYIKSRNSKGKAPSSLAPGSSVGEVTSQQGSVLDLQNLPQDVLSILAGSDNPPKMALGTPPLAQQRQNPGKASLNSQELASSSREQWATRRQVNGSFFTGPQPSLLSTSLSSIHSKVSNLKPPSTVADSIRTLEVFTAIRRHPDSTRRQWLDTYLPKLARVWPQIWHVVAQQGHVLSPDELSRFVYCMGECEVRDRACGEAVAQIAAKYAGSMSRVQLVDTVHGLGTLRVGDRNIVQPFIARFMAGVGSASARECGIVLAEGVKLGWRDQGSCMVVIRQLVGCYKQQLEYESKQGRLASREGEWVGRVSTFCDFLAGIDAVIELFEAPPPEAVVLLQGALDTCCEAQVQQIGRLALRIRAWRIEGVDYLAKQTVYKCATGVAHRLVAAFLMNNNWYRVDTGALQNVFTFASVCGVSSSQLQPLLQCFLDNIQSSHPQRCVFMMRALAENQTQNIMFMHTCTQYLATCNKPISPSFLALALTSNVVCNIPTTSEMAHLVKLFVQRIDQATSSQCIDVLQSIAKLRLTQLSHEAQVIVQTVRQDIDILQPDDYIGLLQATSTLNLITPDQALQLWSPATRNPQLLTTFQIAALLTSLKKVGVKALPRGADALIGAILRPQKVAAATAVELIALVQCFMPWVPPGGDRHVDILVNTFVQKYGWRGKQGGAFWGVRLGEVLQEGGYRDMEVVKKFLEQEANRVDRVQYGQQSDE